MYQRDLFSPWYAVRHVHTSVGWLHWTMKTRQCTEEFFVLAIMACEAARPASSFPRQFLSLIRLLPKCQGITMRKTTRLLLLITSTLDVQSASVAD